VSLKQLAEDLARYLYLPRLRDEDVLIAAIREGLERFTWQSETFAYADAWDESRGRYKGLKIGHGARILTDADRLLVKPEIAAEQMEADRQQAAGGTSTSPAGTGSTGGGTSVVPPQPGTGSGGLVPPPPPARELRRFHGSAKLDPVRLGRDASQIAEEIVQHLTRIVGGNVEITLEIQAELPEAAPEKLVRDVTENCRTLRFDSYGFEEI
jgi:hypothetical protein